MSRNNTITMQVIFCITGILILASISSVDAFVVTRYDLATITTYHDGIYRYLPTRNQKEFFRYQNLSQFCHELRESIFFDTTNNTDASDINDSQFISNTYVIEENDLRREAVQRVVDRVGHGLNTYRLKFLPTFQCFDPEGEMIRAITPGLVPNTAFMSTYRQNETEKIDAERGNLRWDAKFIAIIDVPAVSLQEAPNFNNFIEARRGLKKDPLCRLKKLLKFRLCAIASVGLGNVEHRYVERLPYNLYHQSENDEESCQYLEGMDWTSGHYPKMLLCSIKFTNSEVFNTFYLSLDAVASNNVLFIQQVWNGSHYIHETQYFYVPLLDHLHIYRAALKNLKI